MSLLLLLPSSGGASLYTDDFNRADNTDLGAGWIPANGGTGLQIVSNRATGNPGSSIELFDTDLGSADHYSEADIYFNVAGFILVGVAVRVSTLNGGTFYFARLCPSCGNIAVGKRVGGVESEWTSGGSISTSIPGGPHRVRLEVEGLTLRVYYNGTLTITTSDTDISSGNYSGIRAWGAASEVELDDFQTGSLGAPSSPTGTAPIAEGTDTGSFTGTLTISGTLTAGDTPDAMLAAGTVAISGTLTGADTADTMLASGTHGLIASGTIPGAETPDTTAFTGTVTITGTLTGADTPDTSSMSGVAQIGGVLGAVETVDTTTFTGNVLTPSAGAATIIDDDDVGSFTGVVDNSSIVITGTLNGAEPGDWMRAYGTRVGKVPGEYVAAGPIFRGSRRRRYYNPERNIVHGPPPIPPTET